MRLRAGTRLSAKLKLAEQHGDLGLAPAFRPRCVLGYTANSEESNAILSSLAFCLASHCFCLCFCRCFCLCFCSFSCFSTGRILRGMHTLVPLYNAAARVGPALPSRREPPSRLRCAGEENLIRRLGDCGDAESPAMSIPHTQLSETNYILHRATPRAGHNLHMRVSTMTWDAVGESWACWFCWPSPSRLPPGAAKADLAQAVQVETRQRQGGPITPGALCRCPRPQAEHQASVPNGLFHGARTEYGVKAGYTAANGHVYTV